MDEAHSPRSVRPGKLILAAKAIAKNASFRERTAWLHKQVNPAKDRLKLGDIHRAQRFSHYCDQGKYHHYFIATWAHLNPRDQTKEYELLRDGRVKLPDVESAQQLYSGQQIGSILDRIGGRGVGGGEPAGSSVVDAGMSYANFDAVMGLSTDAMMDVSMDGAYPEGGCTGCASNCGTGCESSACGGGTDGGGDGGGCGGGGG
jgi:hypothetical protein